MSIYKERVDGVSKYDLQKTLPFPFCVCSFFFKGEGGAGGGQFESGHRKK